MGDDPALVPVGEHHVVAVAERLRRLERGPEVREPVGEHRHRLAADLGRGRLEEAARAEQLRLDRGHALRDAVRRRRRGSGTASSGPFIGAEATEAPARARSGASADHGRRA